MPLPEKTSGKQYRFLQGIAHGMKPFKDGPSKKVASEMIHKTPSATRKKLAKKR